MRSRCRDRRLVRALACALATALTLADANARELRVCADPDNLPYSDVSGRGFENRIVELIAADIDAQPRPDAHVLQQTLDASLARLRPRIDAILREYAVVRSDDDMTLETRR